MAAKIRKLTMSYIFTYTGVRPLLQLIADSADVALGIVDILFYLLFIYGLFYIFRLLSFFCKNFNE